MEDFNLQNHSDQIVSLFIDFAPRVILAIITLIIGFMIIKPVVKTFRNVLQKNNIEASLVPFLSNIINIVLRVVLIISVASMIGVETTSFIAVLGAAGLAVGLALQGSLSNFAGGVLILILRPFKVGDVIETQGFVGVVHEIQIFNTHIKTFDNRRIILPNSAVSNNAIINITLEDTRRVDMEFTISYDDDIIKTKEILLELIKSDERVINEPAEPFVAFREMADSALVFVVRAWCNKQDYWGIYFGMQEKVKQRFDQEGISIPFPQRDVHLYTHSN
ncbi:MAG: mechanosensitive ion channel [Cyclobacteriaceae bacterium]|nr:mechanosensitive ion channel [Cyclobacteriaceae bacterium]